MIEVVMKIMMMIKDVMPTVMKQPKVMHVSEMVSGPVASIEMMRWADESGVHDARRVNNGGMIYSSVNNSRVGKTAAVSRAAMGHASAANMTASEMSLANMAAPDVTSADVTSRMASSPMPAVTLSQGP